MESSYRPNVAAVFVRGGKWLLVKKRGRRSWQFPQGGVELGETFELALRREMKEELGISNFRIVSKARYVHEYEWPQKWRNANPEKGGDFVGQRQRFFVCAFPSNQKIRLSSELEKFKWVKREDLFEFIKLPDLREAVRKIFREFLPHF